MMRQMSRWAPVGMGAFGRLQSYSSREQVYMPLRLSIRQAMLSQSDTLLLLALRHRRSLPRLGRPSLLLHQKERKCWKGTARRRRRRGSSY